MWEITRANFFSRWVYGPHTRHGRIQGKWAHQPMLIGAAVVPWDTPARCAFALHCMHDSRSELHSIRLALTSDLVQLKMRRGHGIVPSLPHLEW